MFHKSRFNKDLWQIQPPPIIYQVSLKSLSHLIIPFYLVAEIMQKFREKNGFNRHRYLSTCGRYIYNIAIIDYLQAYDFEKRGEHFIKVWFYFRDGDLISATDPNPYARRFLRFMREHVIINQKAKKRTTSFNQSFVYN